MTLPCHKESFGIRIARTAFLGAMGWICVSVWAMSVVLNKGGTLGPSWNSWTRYLAYSLVRQTYIPVLAIVWALLSAMLANAEVRRRRAIWVALVIGGVTLVCHAVEGVRE